MKPINYLLILFVAFAMQYAPLSAQANLLNSRVPQDIGKLTEFQEETNDATPLAYGYVDDRDVLWSKTIWEIIDLNERINFPYYYPTDTLNLGPDRRSLFDLLKLNLSKGKIKEVYNSSYFQEKLTYDEIQESLMAIDTIGAGYDQYNEEGFVDEEYINKRIITSAEIKQLRIKGTWYFNKRLGELRYRLLGVCPVAADINMQADNEEEEDLVELFWVWYPDARETLNQNSIFYSRNSSQTITFDVMLNTRRFNSIIYKEENVYEDRKVKDYIFEDALRQLLESERIKSVIRDFEQDMWNN